MAQVYPSKIDVWLLLVLLAAVTICIATFILVASSGNVSVIVVALLVLLVGGGLPVWIVVSTCYTLDTSTLLVKSGPCKWRVPIAEITGVTPTSNPLSSPALSLDRLRIDYGRGRSIMISPKNQSQFIQDLDNRRRMAAAE